jgi:hypothetical protein
LIKSLQEDIATLGNLTASFIFQRKQEHVARPGQPQLLVSYCKFCNILFYLWILLAASSLAVGMWRSCMTDEGKGFTDAACIIGLGSLIMFPLQNRHFKKCRLLKEKEMEA